MEEESNAIPVAVAKSKERRGMLGVFTTPSPHHPEVDDPLIQFLMLSNEERENADNAHVPLEQLRVKAREEKAHDFVTFRFEESSDILTARQCALLCVFLEFAWAASKMKDTSAAATAAPPTASDEDTEMSDRFDLRLVIPDEAFVKLMASIDSEETTEATNNQMNDTASNDTNHKNDSKAHSSIPKTGAEQLLTRIQTAFGQVPGANKDVSCKIALRLTKGPTHGCIPFHCDGPNTSSTSQIALNGPNEYQGGNLCFYVNGRVHILDHRPVGSLVQYPPHVLHGVTNSTDGKQKCLYILDQASGMEEEEGEHERDVFQVTVQHVEKFLSLQRQRRRLSSSSRSRKIPNCVACGEEVSNHVLVPCGHLCLCSDCIDSFTCCPKCRTVIKRKQKIHL
jgi:hypothetical protein